MKLDGKGLLVLGIVVAFLVSGAYMLGMSSKDVGVSTSKIVPPASHSAGQPALPSSHPAISAAQESSFFKKPERFNHFRVGSRNVKGMAAKGDKVWVGTSGGIIRYDLKTDDSTLFDVKNGSLLSNGVFHVSTLDDRIVVGTYGGGMSIYNTSTKEWKNYNIPEGLADQFVYDVQKVENGDIWIATWSGVNLVKNGELDNADAWVTYNVENTKGGLPNDWVYGLEQSSDGAMWFATEFGVARLKDGMWKNWQHEDGVGAALALVKDDIKFKNDPGKASRHHARQKQEQGIGDVNVAYNPNYVVSLKVDADGIVWGGTWGGGLARFDGSQWKNFTVKDGLPSNHVFTIFLDDDKTLWVGTSHGLARVNKDKESFSVFTRKDGLFSDNVFSMARASDGSFWVGSFGGVARLYEAR